MAENWKQIKGYEGLYEVSDTGKVRRDGHILKPCVIDRGKGYLSVALSKEGKVKKYLVHRLVATAFISNLQNKEQVNHIDGNSLNNVVDNLEWVSNRENTIHAYNTGLNSKSLKIIVRDIQTDEVVHYPTMRQASLALGYSVGWLYWAFKNKGSEFQLLNKTISKVGENHVNRI